MEALRLRWQRLAGGDRVWWRRIEAAYSEPHRAYHTLEHLAALFNDAAVFEPLTPALEWAIWFHDFVYDPRGSRNEADSARVAQTALAELGEQPAVAARAAALILATQHGAAPASGGHDEEARLLVSLDLAILAAPSARYDAYAEAIRAEYAHVPDEQFRAGRAAFLTQLVASRARLFPHAAFAEREEPARANLARELVRLRG